MKRPKLDLSWPELWKTMYELDRRQVWGEFPHHPEFLGWDARREPVLRHVGNCLPLGSSVVDVASSQGNIAIELSDRGYDVTWNDLNPDLIGYVKLKDSAGRLAYEPGNVFDLARRHPGRWNGVVATEVIEHVAHPDEMFRALAALVRPGGFVFMSTPNGRYMRNDLPRFSEFQDTSAFEAHQFRPDADGHIFFLFPDEIASLSERAGLQLVHFEFVGNPLTSGHMKLAPVTRTMPVPWILAIERLTHRAPRRPRERLHRHSIFTLRRPV